MRIKRGVSTHKTHKKIFKRTKGMQHGARRSIKLARQAVIRSMQYSYRDRRNRKRDFRQLWITRINAAARDNGTSYSQLTKGMSDNSITINRKMLAELAANYPSVFSAVTKAAQSK